MKKKKRDDNEVGAVSEMKDEVEQMRGHVILKAGVRQTNRGGGLASYELQYGQSGRIAQKRFGLV